MTGTGPVTIWSELSRVEWLVRVAVDRWRVLMRESKPAAHWGLIHVTDAEVDLYLQHPFGEPAIDGRPEGESDTGGSGEAVDRDVDAPPVLARLSHLETRFGLEPVDRVLLLLCLLPELDSRYRRVYGYLQNDATRDRPSVALVDELIRPVTGMVGDAHRRLAASKPLRAGHLLDVVGPEVSSDAPVRIDPRILRYLLDDHAVDDRVAPTVVPFTGTPADHLVLAPGRSEQLRDLAQWCAGRVDTGAIVLVHGPPGSGRSSTIAALIHQIGIDTIAIDAARAARSAATFELIADLAQREARLERAAVVWTNAEALLDNGETAAWDTLIRAADRSPALTFVVTESSWDPAGRSGEPPFARLSIPAPDFELRCRLWDRYLPPDADFDAHLDRAALGETLSATFQLTPGQTVDAVATAHGLAKVRRGAEGRPEVDDIVEGCRRQSGRTLLALAHRVEPRRDADFDRLVLPAANRRQLDELRTRIRLRSRLVESGFESRVPRANSLLVLFTGSSGTGKTMAAELLANEQGVDLYRVDLAEVVSKYVGETEKNLRRVFEEAEDANAIIFFDEADALFGKRGEVKESRDRWANIEVNFLLQRVEDYSGVVILATNLRQNLDDAFMRRIHAIVEFPFPDANDRLRIWKGMFPPVERMGRPSDGDLQDIAERFELPGGSIRNVVVDAAFRALDAGGPQPAITTRQLAAAVAREYQKLGKPITPSEFGGELYERMIEDLLLVDGGP